MLGWTGAGCCENRSLIPTDSLHLSGLVRTGMARDSKSKASSRLEEQEEMTVVILRFKGGGETLRERIFNGQRSARDTWARLFLSEDS